MSLNHINSFLKKSNYLLSCCLLIIFFGVLLIHLNTEIIDFDIWLHLKAGEYIVQHATVPLTDPFSFTNAGKPWMNHEWLFQVLVYAFYRWLGPDGMLIFQNIIFLLLFAILGALGKRNKNFLFLSAMLFIGMLVMAFRFTIRPDMMSGLLQLVFLAVLHDKNLRKFLVWLPFLQILWTNMHGFFFLGPLLILIYATAERSRKLWLVFLCSLGATILNPQFLSGAFYPLSVVKNLAADRSILNLIEELSRPFTFKTLFNLDEWLYYKALIIISLFSFRMNWKRFDMRLFIIWCIFFILSLTVMRNIFYFGIVAVTVIFFNMKERLSYDATLSVQRFNERPLFYIGRSVLIFALGFCMARNGFLELRQRYYDFQNYNFKSKMWGVSLRTYPYKAVDFMLRENLPQPMFNDFNSGAFLIGRAYPKRTVFIDGRTEFYGNKFLQLYEKIIDGDEKAIEETINRYSLKGFLLTSAVSRLDDKLARYLFTNPQWKVIYFDESALIFIKAIPENQPFLDRFFLNLNQWSPPVVSFAQLGTRFIYPYPFIKRAFVLRSLGCYEAMFKEAQSALSIAPDIAESYALIGCYYKEKENFEQALKFYRIAVTISPLNTDYRNDYAYVLCRLHLFDEAEKQLAILQQALPNHPDVLYARAVVFNKQKRTKEAQTIIEKAIHLKQKDDSQFLKLYAEILTETGDAHLAIQIYKKILVAEPNNKEIVNKLQQLENDNHS